MVADALRAYAGLASGAVELTLSRAREAATALAAQGLAAGAQVQAVADDLIATSRSNREALVTLIRAEIDRSLTRVGLAPAEELAELTGRVRALEAQVRDLRDDVAKLTKTPRETAPRKAPARKPAARETAARKTTARKTAPPKAST